MTNKKEESDHIGERVMNPKSKDATGLNYAYDIINDVLEIEGIRYAGELFRNLSWGIRLNEPFEITERADKIIVVRDLKEKWDSLLKQRDLLRGAIKKYISEKESPIPDSVMLKTRYRGMKEALQSCEGEGKNG